MSDDFYHNFQYRVILPMARTAVQDTFVPPTRFDTLAQAGTRVAFRQNLQSVLTYREPPTANMPGTVVMVRTASGDTTHYDGRVFVAWQDGTFGHYLPEHLQLVPEKWAERTARQNTHRLRIASSYDLMDFLKVGSTDLVHKATRDLWSIQSGKSGVEIVRLFDDTGKPIKA